MIKQIKSSKKRTIVIVVIASLAVIVPIMYLIHNSSTAIAAPLIAKDPNLKVEAVITGLSSPTSMAFIDNNNILVLEKSGQVRLVSNGVPQGKPVLQVSDAIIMQMNFCIYVIYSCHQILQNIKGYSCF
jgi:hypothetical protein